MTRSADPHAAAGRPQRPCPVRVSPTANLSALGAAHLAGLEAGLVDLADLEDGLGDVADTESAHLRAPAIGDGASGPARRAAWARRGDASTHPRTATRPGDRAG